ncbi:MAG: nitrogenase cofactor biosynthesis protein NifB [Bacillota bacterium]
MQCSCKRNIDNNTDSSNSKHPCYSFDAQHKYARLHLPVAPHCNISCNYCNRKFDCLHESRPGVTSEILNPIEALLRFQKVKERIEHLSVVGIAGPGDALANWASVRKTIDLIQKSDTDILFCLSTNGLMLPEYAAEIIELGLKHVTVTVNCLDQEIGAKIYEFVNYKGSRYWGKEAAQILIGNQLEGIAYLSHHGVLVKVNIVMVEGINDHHVPDIVRKVRDLGAFMTNIMPLIPAKGSSFEHYPETNIIKLNEMRKKCQTDLLQMYHCRQCRADAVGLLGNDRSLEFTEQVQKGA